MAKLEPRRARGLDAAGVQLEGTVLVNVRKAFDALPWVQCWRNNTGKLHDRNGRLVTYGLAIGSSDLIGIVHMRRPVIGHGGIQVGWSDGPELGLGRFFALELKKPGETPTDDQLRFLDVVRSMGGAAAWVDNVDDAVAFVHRAREGQDR